MCRKILLSVALLAVSAALPAAAGCQSHHTCDGTYDYDRCVTDGFWQWEADYGICASGYNACVNSCTNSCSGCLPGDCGTCMGNCLAQSNCSSNKATCESQADTQCNNTMNNCDEECPW